VRFGTESASSFWRQRPKAFGPMAVERANPFDHAESDGREQSGNRSMLTADLRESALFIFPKCNPSYQKSNKKTTLKRL